MIDIKLDITNYEKCEWFEECPEEFVCFKCPYFREMLCEECDEYEYFDIFYSKIDEVVYYQDTLRLNSEYYQNIVCSDYVDY